MTITRRRLLAAAGLGTIGAMAGCLDDESDPGLGSGDGDDEDDTDDTGEDDEPGEDDTGEDDDSDDHEDDDSDDEEADTVEAESTSGVADYTIVPYEADDGDTTAEHFTARDAVESFFDLDETATSARERIEDLLGEIDFEADSVIALETQGQSGCYELVVESIEVDSDDSLSITAVATDTSEADEACTEALVNLGAFVWVTHEDDTPTSGSVSITSGDGSQHSFGWDSASDAEEGDA